MGPESFGVGPDALAAGPPGMQDAAGSCCRIGMRAKDGFRMVEPWALGG